MQTCIFKTQSIAFVYTIAKYIKIKSATAQQKAIKYNNTNIHIVRNNKSRKL